MEKFTTWKFFFSSLDEFSRKKSAHFQRDEGWFPVPLFWDDKRGKWRWKFFRFRLRCAPAFFPFSVILIFQQDTTHRPATPPKTGTKWLKTVYIIPTTFSSNDKIVKRIARRRSRVTSKTLRLAAGVTNSKIYFHLLPTETRFLPAFRSASLVQQTKMLSVCLSCVRCGIVE